MSGVISEVCTVIMMAHVVVTTCIVFWDRSTVDISTTKRHLDRALMLFVMWCRLIALCTCSLAQSSPDQPVKACWLNVVIIGQISEHKLMFFLFLLFSGSYIR